ncbi:MAG: rod shape-determining protein MreC [Alphaproteobacteria bacterium]|nr:MAG: rod shape-determining protein MreC [Alphaproteobacteria bacterium]
MVAVRQDSVPSLGRTLRQVFLGAAVLGCLAVFVLWRIDSPRVERIRMALADRLMPGLEWTARPIAGISAMIADFQSYTRVYEQNEELRRELQRLRGWREAALQLEQENARLRALNNVHISPRHTFTTAEVLADSGGPFRQSALINIGQRDGVRDGAAVLDGLGLIGRISGVGMSTARVIFLTDANSRVPVLLKPSGRRAIVVGDNSQVLRLEFLEAPGQIRPGDRVVTSGDGAVLPPDLLLGEVIVLPSGGLGVRLAADFGRLEFVRVLRPAPVPAIEGPGSLITPTSRRPPAIAADPDIAPEMR